MSNIWPGIVSVLQKVFKLKMKDIEKYSEIIQDKAWKKLHLLALRERRKLQSVSPYMEERVSSA